MAQKSTYRTVDEHVAHLRQQFAGSKWGRADYAGMVTSEAVKAITDELFAQRKAYDDLLNVILDAAPQRDRQHSLGAENIVKSIIAERDSLARQAARAASPATPEGSSND